MAVTALDRACDALRGHRAALTEADELPRDVADLLSRSGLVDLCLPRRLGGGGGDLADLVTAVERVAAVDAATAWCLFIFGTAPWLFARAREDLVAEVFDRPGVLVAGALAPTGKLRRDGDGFTLDGRWAFGSGVSVCDWVAVHAVLVDAPEPRSAFAVVPAKDIDFREPWDGLGLTASGSGAFGIRERFVPGHRLIAGMAGPPVWPEPPFRLSFRATFAACAAVLLGIAAEALETFIGYAGTKRPTFGRGVLAEQPAVQALVARCWGGLAAARALLYQTVGEVACDDGPGPQARLRIAMNGVRATCLSIVNDLHFAAGGAAATHTDRFARLLRDAHTASQHYMFSDDVSSVAGAVLLGLDVPPGLL
jgi:alkylation response protein AidB-like acyl-CoA dehydrogenase